MGRCDDNVIIISNKDNDDLLFLKICIELIDIRVHSLGLRLQLGKGLL